MIFPGNSGRPQKQAIAKTSFKLDAFFENAFSHVDIFAHLLEDEKALVLAMCHLEWRQ